MSVEQKLDKVLDKLEQTRIDIEVLCTIVKGSTEDIKETEKDIRGLQDELDEIKIEVNSLKQVVAILKWVVGVAVTFASAIIGNMFI